MVVFAFMSVNVFLSLNRQELLAVVSSTSYHRYLSLTLFFILICDLISFFLLSLLFV